MADQSILDSNYFIDYETYNCPFCNRRHVACRLLFGFEFDWTDKKTCYVYQYRCNSCEKKSLHFSFQPLHTDWASEAVGVRFQIIIPGKEDLDRKIFHSIPSSFFVMDERIPTPLRELLSEADGCLKMNFLTGASACSRKAIYELLRIQGAAGEHYSDRIKDLKSKFPSVDAEMFDVLDQVKDMTSDKVHEESWAKWDSGHIRFFLEVLKSILLEIYVVPDERKRRSSTVQALRRQLDNDKKAVTPAPPAGPPKPAGSA